MTILIGTSGFSYKDWVGPVYPEGLPRQEWLVHYGTEFPTCELNFSTCSLITSHFGTGIRRKTAVEARSCF